MSHSFKKRILSRQEEQALRLLHQDFEGLAKPSVAKEMGVSIARLNQVLRSAKEKAPGLFPILTPVQYTILRALESGTNRLEIANETGLNVKQVDNAISGLHKLGIPVYHRPKIVRYNPGLDNKIVNKF